MSTPVLINQYPIMSGIQHHYPVNNITLPPNGPLPHPVALAGLSTLPFINSCDFNTQLMSPMNYNIVNDMKSSIMMDNTNQKLPNDNSLSIRILMSGKEVGSIIGKRGDNIKKFREESMARINISDGNSSERIVTISGSCKQIHFAVKLICKKFENDFVKPLEKSNETVPIPLSIRILMQSFQYDNIIGNGGIRIKQLKDSTDATILFGMEFITTSSERLLTLSGSSDSVANCILELCKILIEISNSQYVLPFSPKVLPYPEVGQSLTINGNNNNNKMISPTFGENISVATNSLPILPLQNIYSPSFYTDHLSYPLNFPYPLIHVKLQGPISHFIPNISNDSIMKSSTTNHFQQQNIIKEFFVDNEMIGCIIGRGGSTINEIRAVSGAQIKISNSEDGKQERKISICGTYESVQTAQLLINSSIQLYKQSLKLKTAMKTNNPFIMSNPLIASTSPIGTLLPQWNLNNSLMSPSNQPIYPLPTSDFPDLNQMVVNINQLHNSNFTFNSVSSSCVDSSEKSFSKMKASQVNLDGNKCKSNDNLGIASLVLIIGNSRDQIL